MAPAASLFAVPVGLMTTPFDVGADPVWPSDAYLQQTAAQTNAFISNNSWNYVGPDSETYDLHAASYDAAVRDALPNVTGSQPLLLVFSAGNGGGGNADGTGRQSGHHPVAGHGQERHHGGRHRAIPQCHQPGLEMHGPRHDQLLQHQSAVAGHDRRQ